MDFHSCLPPLQALYGPHKYALSERYIMCFVQLFGKRFGFSSLSSVAAMLNKNASVHSSHEPHCSHEKMCLSNYWRITIIYVWKRNLPLAFVAQHEMNPAQLSHFVSLHDCSLALSTPVASALRLGPPQVLIIASVPLVTAQSPRIGGQGGQRLMM